MIITYVFWVALVSLLLFFRPVCSFSCPCLLRDWAPVSTSFSRVGMATVRVRMTRGERRGDGLLAQHVQVLEHEAEGTPGIVRTVVGWSPSLSCRCRRWNSRGVPPPAACRFCARTRNCERKPHDDGRDAGHEKLYESSLSSASPQFPVSTSWCRVKPCTVRTRVFDMCQSEETCMELRADQCEAASAQASYTIVVSLADFMCRHLTLSKAQSPHFTVRLSTL